MFYRTSFSRRLKTYRAFPELLQQIEMDDEILFLGRLGWKFEPWPGFDLEAGVKVFLPFSPSSGPHHRYREAMGGFSQFSQRYTGEELARVVMGYLLGNL
jgi:hypothetical protein